MSDPEHARQLKGLMQDAIDELGKPAKKPSCPSCDRRRKALQAGCALPGAFNNKDAVYVDLPIHAYGRMQMCHMFSGNLERLHEMADKIGIERKWFQDKPDFPHYDICKTKRAQAVKLGAVQVLPRDMVKIVRQYYPKPPK